MRKRGALIGALAVLILGTAYWFFMNQSEATMEERRAESVAFTMGTIVNIIAEGEAPEAAIGHAVAELERLTDMFDRFDPDSEIARLNQSGDEWTPLSSEVLGLIEQALEMAALTGGAFDPTITPLIELWGFVETDSDEGSDSPTPMRGVVPPATEEIKNLLKLVDYTAVQVDTDSGRVRLALPGQQMDLGAMVKGYAADRAAEILKAQGVGRGLIDLGGDLYAIGSRVDGSPWRLGIRHPRDSSSIVGILYVEDKAVATSGDYERYFEYEGVRFTHILDPSTGMPAQGVMSATVVAPTGIEADVLSTAAFVLGVDRGLALLESLPDIEGILIDTDYRINITSGLGDSFELRSDSFHWAEEAGHE